MAGFTPLPKPNAKNSFQGGFLDQDYAEKVIARLNAFCNWQVKKDKNNGIDANDGGVVTRWAQELPDVLQTNASLVLQSNNGILSWGPGIPIPFSIVVQQKPGSTTQWQFGVIFNSLLYSNANVTAPPTIPTQAIATGANGLLTSATPTTTDAGWVTWNAANDYVWLEGAFGTWPAISTAQIQSLSNGGSYGGGDCENDGGSGTPTIYTQTKFRVLIGTLTAPVSPVTKPIVKQICNRNLKLYPCWMDSFNSSGASETIIAAIYPFVCQA